MAEPRRDAPPASPAPDSREWEEIRKSLDFFLRMDDLEFMAQIEPPQNPGGEPKHEKRHD